MAFLLWREGRRQKCAVSTASSVALAFISIILGIFIAAGLSEVKWGRGENIGERPLEGIFAHLAINR